MGMTWHMTFVPESLVVGMVGDICALGDFAMTDDEPPGLSLLMRTIAGGVEALLSRG